MAKQKSAQGTQGTQAASPIVQAVPGAKVAFRQGSARSLYHARFMQFNGKPLADLEKDVASAPPSTPKKGKLAEKQEPFAGWVAWFVRHGYFTLVQPKG